MTRRPLVIATAALVCSAIAAGSVGSAAALAHADSSAAAPQVFVLNTQLRGIIDPDILPTGAWGHLQVKLTETADGTWAPEWKGRLYNPDGHQFVTGLIVAREDGGGGAGTIGDGGEVVVVGSVLFDLFRGGSASCGIIELETPELTSEDYLPADVGARMIIDPEIHEVVLISSNGSLVAGGFGAGTPESTTGGGMTGPAVRCSTGG